MKKNDKLIVILGALCIVLASFGIFFYAPTDEKVSTMNADEIYAISGSMSRIPDAVSVSDDCPFYPLIATPLAVHYDTNGGQEIIPLYIENLDDPSTAVTKVKYQLGLSGTDEYVIDGSKSAKEVSLEIAQNFWESSEAVLLIEDNESGYNLGVIATPIASYLSIPIIVTDEIDSEVTEVLIGLGVKSTIICGKNLEGYGNVLRFESVEEIVDATIDLLLEKFGDIDYVTLTNPIDAWPPEVLDSKEFNFEPRTINSLSLNKLTSAVKALLKGYQTQWTFTIPKDYKYALIKFEGINHEVDDIEEFGDAVEFSITSNSKDAPTGTVITGGTGGAGNPIRDASGKIISDRLLQESVLYDQGGVECTVKVASGSWSIKETGEVSANVIVEKLGDPVYPLMKGLSGIAPYLTAYHKGIVFGKPEFAFTADDDVITDKGETCPGFYVPRRNAPLVPLLNKHMFDKVHDPLNNLLAKLADIPLDDDRDLENLQSYYKDSPVYIALVGGGTVLPNYIYQNHVEPVGDIDGDGTDDTSYWVGAGTPSDVIYGNIDPIRYDWSNQANDVYSEYPFMENIVGRITGWDAQDASALVARSVFYDDIVSNLEGWKDNFALLVGGGQDFQTPPVRHAVANVLGQLSDPGEPLKLFTGYTEQCMLRTRDQVAEPLGFTVQTALYEEAMRKGLSDSALDEIKQVNFFNKLFFNKRQVEKLAGDGYVYGGEFMESSNFIFSNGHGCQNHYGMAGDDLTAAGIGLPIIQGKFIQEILKKTVVSILGGFTGPGADLSKVGDYGTRDVSNMDLGPSFMWLESCICGKIDGVYPKASSAQAHLHAGLVVMISASTGSNIGGGYLEPKNMKLDITPLVNLKYLKNKMIDWKNEQYDPAHFGFKIYGDLCKDLRENDVSIGLAFRNAINNYLLSSEEIDWEVWWTPPLISTGNVLLDAELNQNNELYRPMSSSGKGPMMDSKYVSFQEYLLFGDPALNLYEPINEG